MLIEQPPLILRMLYPRAFWRMDKHVKAVYLTFDDGPIPEITHGCSICWINTISKPPSFWWATMYASIPKNSR